MVTPYYQDDYVTLYHGDCLTEHREWLDADVLVTDPPYGMALDTGFRTKASGRRQAKIPIAGDASPAARDAALEAWNGPGLVFGTWRVSRPENTRNVVVWDKGASPGVGNTDIPWGFSHEEIYIIGKWPPRPKFGVPLRSGSVIRVDAVNPSASDRPKHPTPKPVALMERLIEKCPPGVIADPFAGAGATLVAAKALGRKVIGVELEEKYCEIIAKRCAQELLELEWTA